MLKKLVKIKRFSIKSTKKYILTSLEIYNCNTYEAEAVF